VYRLAVYPWRFPLGKRCVCDLHGRHSPLRLPPDPLNSLRQRYERAASLLETSKLGWRSRHGAVEFTLLADGTPNRFLCSGVQTTFVAPARVSHLSHLWGALRGRWSGALWTAARGFAVGCAQKDNFACLPRRLATPCDGGCGSLLPHTRQHSSMDSGTDWGSRFQIHDVSTGIARRSGRARDILR